MTILHRLLHQGAARLRRHLAPLRDDRGDNPVPTAVIIGGMVILAVAVLVSLYALTGAFLEQAPTELPQPAF